MGPVALGSLLEGVLSNFHNSSVNSFVHAMTTILHRRKLSHRAMRQVAPVHPSGKGGSWDPSILSLSCPPPSRSAPSPLIFSRFPGPFSLKAHPLTLPVLLEDSAGT